MLAGIAGPSLPIIGDKVKVVFQGLRIAAEDLRTRSGGLSVYIIPYGTVQELVNRNGVFIHKATSV